MGAGAGSSRYRVRAFTVCAVGLAVAGVGCGSTRPHAQAHAATPPASGRTLDPGARLIDARCRLPMPRELAGGSKCSMLVVPGRPTLRLPVVRVGARWRRTGPPLIVLQGGPGGTAAPLLIGLERSALRDGREIVVLEQRGAPAAQPALTCPPPRHSGVFVTPGRSCGVQLAKQFGGSLNGFDAEHSARDVASLISELGVPKADVYGMSWGSRVALEVLRADPGVVRRAVLDGVVPAQADLFADSAPSLSTALEQLSQACASQPRCRRAHPHLDADMRAAARRPGASTAVYAAMSSPRTLRATPAIITAIARNQTATARAMLRPLGRPSGIATGANSAALCRDIGLLTTPRRVNDRAKTVSPLANEAGLSALDLLTDCAGWPVDPVSRAQIQPVRSDAPVLLLSGRFDPTTPPAYAAAAARTLPRSQSVLFNSGTHVAYGTPCAAAIVDRFLRTGHADRPPCARARL